MSRPLQIAVDARPLAFPATGNATYLYRMLSELLALRPDDHWLLISHRGLHPVFADLASRSAVEIEIAAGLTAKAGPLWMHLAVPRILRERKPDVFWGTLAMLPHRYRERCPDVPAFVNFHDLNSVRAPQTMPAWKRAQHRLFDHRSIAAATRVLCLSETTRHDILDYLPDTPPEKLSVVYPGAEAPDVKIARAPAAPVGAFKDFLLCVGTLEPRKNQATLLEGYLRARKERHDLPPLVFAGRRGWDDALYARLSSGELEADNVFYLEGCSDGELAWLYANAAFVTLPSVHEGFGLPVIEAFQAGKAVLLSDIPIFREVGLDSRFVSVKDAGDWAAGILEYHQQKLAGELGVPADFEPDEWTWRHRATVLSELWDDL